MFCLPQGLELAGGSRKPDSEEEEGAGEKEDELGEREGEVKELVLGGDLAPPNSGNTSSFD